MSSSTPASSATGSRSTPARQAPLWKRTRTTLNNDLLWHLHDLWPEQTLPGSALFSNRWARRIARRLARVELRQMRELSRTIDALETEIAELVAQVAPQLLTEPGFGPLTAAKLIGEIAGAQRFSSDAKLARAGGIAPTYGTYRHRPDRGGNRQINTAIHRVAVTRCHPEPAATASLGPLLAPPWLGQLHGGCRSGADAASFVGGFRRATVAASGWRRR